MNPYVAQLSDNSSPSASAMYDNSVPTTPNTGITAPTPVSSLSALPPGTWVALALLVLAVIALIALLGSNTYTRTVERNYNRRYGSF